MAREILARFGEAGLLIASTTVEVAGLPELRLRVERRGK